MPKYNIKVGIIGGTGFDKLAKYILSEETHTESNCGNSIESEHCTITSGTIKGVPVAIILRHGKGHRLSPSQVHYGANIRVLKSIGCTHVLATTACGSLSETITPGQLVVPDSFIDRTYLRKNTLYDGTSEPSSEYSGVCHVPMEPAFDRRTSNILVQAAKESGINIMQGGTVVTIEGPRFSSKAESRAFQQWGGHLVNMTTCPEVIMAKEAGLLYASIAVATDYDCWRDSEISVCVADVKKVFQQNVDKVIPVLVKAIELIGQQDWDQDIDNLKTLIVESFVSEK